MKSILPFTTQSQLLTTKKNKPWKTFNPLPDDKILDWSKLKQVTPFDAPGKQTF